MGKKSRKLRSPKYARKAAALRATVARLRGGNAPEKAEEAPSTTKTLNAEESETTATEENNTTPNKNTKTTTTRKAPAKRTRRTRKKTTTSTTKKTTKKTN